VVGKDRIIQVETAPTTQTAYIFTGAGERAVDDAATSVEASGDKPVVENRPLAFTAKGTDNSFLYVEGTNGTAMELDPVMVNTETGEVVYATPCVSKRLAHAQDFRVVQMNDDLTPGLSSVFKNGAWIDSGGRFGTGIRGRRNHGSSRKNASCTRNQ